MWCIFALDMSVVDDVKYGSNTSTRMDQLRAIPALFKLRLATLVVLSSVLGYFTATTVVDWRALGILCLGGFLLTGASNGLNQVWERDIDKLMERTRNRPIPTGVLSPLQATVISRRNNSYLDLELLLHVVVGWTVWRMYWTGWRLHCFSLH